MVKVDLASLGVKKPAPQAQATEPVAGPQPAAKGRSLLAALGISKSPAPATAPINNPSPVPAQPQPPQVEVDTVDSTPVIEAKPVIQVIEGPENFQNVLNKFDSLVAGDKGIDVLNLDAARRYVETIMVTLRSFPEYDGILVARDVHNVMMFIRASKSLTEATYVKTNEKRAKREAKAKNKVTFDFSSFGGPATPALLPSLDDLAGFNADAIEAKNRK